MSPDIIIQAESPDSIMQKIYRKKKNNFFLVKASFSNKSSLKNFQTFLLITMIIKNDK